MKKIAFLAILVALFSGCLWNNTETEEQVPDADQLLLKSEKTLAEDLAGFNIGITTALWTQQIEGISGTALYHYNYIYGTDETNTLWADFYYTLKDLDSVIILMQGKSNYYEAVAKILTAVALGNLTDLFGDVPFSESFRLDSPRFDSQQEIYAQIFSYLDDGINLINSGDQGQVALGYGDAIYNWDMQRWLKAAYTLKARYMMHLVDVENVNYDEVMDYLNKGMASNSDDMRFYFFTVGDLSPVYKYLTDKDGIKNNLKFQQLLGEYEDPRTMVLAYDGFWARQDGYFPFVQYTEALFLRSEVCWRQHDTIGAKEALKQAVYNSLEKYLVTDLRWHLDYSQYVDTLGYDTLIYEIIRQKYVDLMYHPEAFNDWRRFDYPDLQPVAGDSIPVRFPYAQNELDKNPNAPAWGTDVDLYTPVWWDVNTPNGKKVKKFN